MEILNLKISINELNSLIKGLKIQNINNNNNATVRQITQTNSVTSTDNTTVPMEVKGFKPLNLDISTGNEGASTDRQTDTSTDRQRGNQHKIEDKDIDLEIKEASRILDSLDGRQKEKEVEQSKNVNPFMERISTTAEKEIIQNGSCSSDPKEGKEEEKEL